MRELIERISARAGARPEIVERPAEAIEAAGLSVPDASPFSSAWSSLLDPSRAVVELDFEHPPLDAYLDATIASLLATWPLAPPPGYAQRDRELALAARRDGVLAAHDQTLDARGHALGCERLDQVVGDVEVAQPWTNRP